MKTPILRAVAKPVLILGAPLPVLIVNGGVFILSYLLAFPPVICIGLFAGLQGLAFIKARNNPYFDRLWVAYLTRRRHSTKSILPSKGHRYAGR